MQQESRVEESVMKSVDSSQSSVGPGQLLNQEDQDHMELLENILSIPSWSELGVRNWEYAATDSKLTKSELSGLLGEKQIKAAQEGVPDPQIGDMVDDAFLFAQLQQQRSMLAEGSLSQQLTDRSSLDMVGVQASSEHLLQRIPEEGSIGLPMGPSMLPSGPRPESGQPQTLMSPSWRPSYVGSMPVGLGQPNPEIFLRDTNSNGSQLYGRGLELGSREGPPGVMFNVYPQIPQPRPPIQPSQQAASNNTPTPSFRPQAASTQSQPTNPIAGGAPRPRVRARRGQATDPHSIAERLRRERIAERMKALQDLVPNANKTDKASMLDEIVDYVKFLQLQVKVLSMSRLGGAGAVPSLVADLPAEGANSLLASTLSRGSGISHDGLASAERQVARLMDEDMGSAMQYLQSKGLCLMPISLATASGKVPLSALQAIGSNDNKPFTEASVTVATDRGGSGNNNAAGATNATAGANVPVKISKDAKDVSDNKSSDVSRQPLKSPRTKTSDESSQRRAQ